MRNRTRKCKLHYHSTSLEKYTSFSPVLKFSFNSITIPLFTNRSESELVNSLTAQTVHVYPHGIQWKYATWDMYHGMYLYVSMLRSVPMIIWLETIARNLWSWHLAFGASVVSTFVDPYLKSGKICHTQVVQGIMQFKIFEWLLKWPRNW